MRFKFLTSRRAFLTATSTIVFCTAIAGLTACSGINDSWEVKGGGYLKYSINGGEEITQELERNDVEIPYIRNNHHYLLIKVPIDRSERKDQMNIMVNEPKLGKNAIVASYTWLQVLRDVLTVIDAVLEVTAALDFPALVDAAASG